MNFSTTPPNASIAARAAAKYRPTTAWTSSGSASSDMAVNATRSQNSEVTTLRSSATGRSTCSGAAHSGQNLKRSGDSAPHAPHVIMLGPY